MGNDIRDDHSYANFVFESTDDTFDIEVSTTRELEQLDESDPSPAFSPITVNGDGNEREVDLGVDSDWGDFPSTSGVHMRDRSSDLSPITLDEDEIEQAHEQDSDWGDCPSPPVIIQDMPKHDFHEVKALRRRYLASKAFYVDFLTASDKASIEEVANVRGGDYQYTHIVGKIRLPGTNKYLCIVKWRESAYDPKKLNSADELKLEERIYEKYGTVVYVGNAGQELILPGFMNRDDLKFKTKVAGLDLHLGHCNACGAGPMLRRSAAEHFQTQHAHNTVLLACNCRTRPILSRTHPHHRECRFCVCDKKFQTAEQKIKHLSKCFMCHCGYSGKSRSALARHGVKDCLQCGQCRRKFKTLKGRKSHNEKCFACINLSCKWRCNNLSELIEHRQLCLFEPLMDEAYEAVDSSTENKTNAKKRPDRLEHGDVPKRRSVRINGVNINLSI